MEFLKFDELKENFLKLIEAKFELKKLEITEQAEVKIVDLVYLIIKVLVVFVIYILLVIGLSFLIGNYFGMPYLGFLVFLIIHIILLLYLFNQKVKIKEVISLKVKNLFSGF